MSFSSLFIPNPPPPFSVCLAYWQAGRRDREL
jgi:hypothetical protein